MVLIILHCQQTPFSHLASSFATMCLVLAGCWVCIPSYSVPNCGSMSEIWWRLLCTRWQQLQAKPECAKEWRVPHVAEQSISAALQKKRTLYKTITVQHKVKIARYMYLWEWLICKYFTREHLNTTLSSICKFKNRKSTKMGNPRNINPTKF